MNHQTSVHKSFQTSWSHLEVVHLLLKENYQNKKKQSKFYHMLKLIFYFSNREFEKKIILQRESQTFISQ